MLSRISAATAASRRRVLLVLRHGLILHAIARTTPHAHAGRRRLCGAVAVTVTSSVIGGFGRVTCAHTHAHSVRSVSLRDVHTRNMQVADRDGRFVLEMFLDVVVLMRDLRAA